MRIIGIENECGQKDADGKYHDPNINSADLADIVTATVSDWKKYYDPATTATVKSVAQRMYPNACSVVPVGGISGCLQSARAIQENKRYVDILEKYPMPAISNITRAETYSVRKKFSDTTIKTGFHFIGAEDAVAQSAYVSFYPAVNVIQNEKWAKRLDPISFDLGVMKPSGEEGSQSFKNAKQIYMIGIGVDLSGGLALHLGDAFWQDSGGHHRFNVGITYNVLSLFDSLNRSQ